MKFYKELEKDRVGLQLSMTNSEVYPDPMESHNDLAMRVKLSKNLVEQRQKFISFDKQDSSTIEKVQSRADLSSLAMRN